MDAGLKSKGGCVCLAPMQYESPGAETLLSPSEGVDAHTLLRLQQGFGAGPLPGAHAQVSEGVRRRRRTTLGTPHWSPC